MNEVVYVMLGVIVLAVLFVAWLMKRSSDKFELPELRGPGVIRQTREIIVPKGVLVTREIQQERQPNGIFVVMKSELIEELAMLASRRRLSRSALCRELIKRGLEAERKVSV